MKQPTDNRGTAGPSARAPDRAHDDAAADATDMAHPPFGPFAPAILGTEHWSLLGGRSLIWNEALNRTTVFLTVLSASIIALALLADATGFGPQTATLALVLLPVVLLLGIATYVRLVQINTEEVKLVLAMNRLRHAYLKIEPGLEWLWVYFLVNTPIIVATVVAALAAAIAVLVLRTVGAPRAAVVAGGVVAFLTLWGGLMPLQRHVMDPSAIRCPDSPLRRTSSNQPQWYLELGLPRSTGFAPVDSPRPRPTLTESMFAPPDARPRGTGRTRRGRQGTAEAVDRPFVHVTAMGGGRIGDGRGPAGWRRCDQ